MSVLSGAEAFVHDGSTDVGVLLCHGMTSTPQSVRAWGEYLAAEGISVRCPLLPGHGTRWPDLNETTWHDWYRAAETELAQLQGRCRSVFVGGLSMGATLTLRLGQQHPEIAGLIVVNPSVMTKRIEARLLPVLSKVLPSLGAIASDIAKPGVTELAYPRLPLKAMASLRQLWGVVRPALGRIRQPVLLFHSTVDHVVEPENSEIVLRGIASDDVTEVELTDSFHVATLDHDAPRIFSGSVEFLQRIHRERVEEVG